MIVRTYSAAAARKAVALALLAFALICGLGSRAAAQDTDEERRQNIRRLLEITKAVELGAQAGEQAIAQLKGNLAQLFPNVHGQGAPEVMVRIGTVFEEEVRKEFTPEKLVSSITPIYEKYLSNDEVKALIAFYESPLGQKVVTVLPQIMREAFEDGSARGRQAGMRAVERLREEGILPTRAQPEPEAEPPAAKPPSRGGARRTRRKN